MAVVTKRWLEAGVSLYGVSEYAESGEEDRPIRAGVSITRHVENDGGIDMLGLVVPLCASRLLSLGRREPSIVAPMMEVVAASSIGIAKLGEQGSGDFRVREIVDSADPVTLALPVVEIEPAGSAERETRLILQKRRGGGAYFGEFKISKTAANPVITCSALFATLEYVARFGSFKKAARPTATGLAALYAAWAERGSPLGVSVAESAEVDSLILAAIIEKYVEDLEDPGTTDGESSA